MLAFPRFRGTGPATNSLVDLHLDQNRLGGFCQEYLPRALKLIGALSGIRFFSQQFKNNGLDKRKPHGIKAGCFNDELDLLNSINYHLKSTRYSGAKISYITFFSKGYFQNFFCENEFHHAFAYLAHERRCRRAQCDYHFGTYCQCDCWSSIFYGRSKLCRAVVSRSIVVSTGSRNAQIVFFAVLWLTAPVRLIGLFFPSEIQIATFAYGVVTYCQIALPVIIIINSRLIAPAKSLLVTLFISATIFLSNFAATELLFALGYTTIFVVYSLDAERDPRAFRRLFIGFLLLASYEIVALSKIPLAIGVYTVRRSKKVSFKELALFAILVLALPFQIICHFGETSRPGHDAFHWFVFAISGIFIAALLVGAIYFKLVGENFVLRTAAPLVAFAVPLCILIVPELIGLRTREFQYAYPSRIYSAGIVALIASLPMILIATLFNGRPDFLLVRREAFT